MTRGEEMAALRFSCLLCRVFLVRRSKLLLEILALRQQLAVLARQQKRPRLKNRDRIFWILISRIFTGWEDCLQLVKPDTVIRWHRKGFRAYWRWKSRPRRPGRPTIDWDGSNGKCPVPSENAVRVILSELTSALNFRLLPA